MRDIGLFSRMILDVETVYMSVDSRGRFSDVLNFLSNAAEVGYDVSTDDLIQRPDAVTVATVHKIKGRRAASLRIAAGIPAGFLPVRWPTRSIVELIRVPRTKKRDSFTRR
jgi:DNA helicase-2/ATP-dependent DNA helicase PcrA